MTLEIELKFIATPAGLEAVRTHLSSFPALAVRQLSNTYYETTDGLLNQHKMGLRIRSCDGEHEMTLKTAGTAVNGLHQRSEFNVPLPEAVLDLELFPPTVWPELLSVAQLKPVLNALFSTHFARECWHISHNQSQFELAIDQGEIRAGELWVPISEIELELLSGDPADLVAFAAQLSRLEGLCLGNQSKAERGYHLANGTKDQELRAFTILHLPIKANVEQAMIATLEAALAHWQYHQALWLSGNKSAKREIRFALAVIKQIWQILGGILPRKATATLREQFSVLETQLSNEKADAQASCYAPSYVTAQLSVLAWLCQQQWRPWLDDKKQKKLAGSFKRFADVMLNRSAAELKEVVRSSSTVEQYRDQLPRLQRELITFMLLSGAYAEDEVYAYLSEWRTLEQAIRQQQLPYIERCGKQALLTPAFWLHSGV